MTVPIRFVDIVIITDLILLIQADIAVTANIESSATPLAEKQSPCENLSGVWTD